MSSEKRRRARIQGGWAASSPGTSRLPPGTKSHPTQHDEGKATDKPKITTQPAWLGKNVDAVKPKKYVFEEPAEVAHGEQKITMLKKSGVYDISLGPSGISRIRLFNNFLDEKECESMYDELFNELLWRQRSDMKNGQEYLQPRLTAWFGDHPYSYSGVVHQANIQWTRLLCELKQRLEDNTGVKYNSLLANLYRDGHDHVPWHSDDEPALHDNPTIASLSFGDSRMFELRKKPSLEQRELGDYSQCEIVRVPLDAGSLLIMEGATQQDWHHRVSKEYHDRGPRINLTFRVIYPEK